MASDSKPNPINTVLIPNTPTSLINLKLDNLLKDREIIQNLLNEKTAISKIAKKYGYKSNGSFKNMLVKCATCAH